MKTKEEVVKGVEAWMLWWIDQRKSKLEEQLNETMSVNPFLLPFLFGYHELTDFEGLADLIVASHLMTGHSTGFGKLIDEKILPRVFGTTKLDASFRRKTNPYANSCFDEVDHIVVRENGVRELLSLKAGKWSIQLTMAVQLNKAFEEIIKEHGAGFQRIVVGVFYGEAGTLTDKYEILRGINRGANHNVVDLQERVVVFCGREFWQWLNDGEAETQEWVLEGIVEATKKSKIHETAKELLMKFKSGVVKKYETDVREEGGGLNWFKLLSKINR